MADTEPRRRLGFVTFPEAPVSEEGVVALLVTKGDDGALRAYVKAYPGRAEPDPEIVALLKQSVEIANL